MPGAMPCSRWSVLPARMIWTRPISVRQCRRRSHGQRISAATPVAGKWQHARSIEDWQATPILSADESAAERDRLLGEIGSLPSPDSATSWAREALVAKNKLTVADAKLLEDAFEQKIAEFPTAEFAEPRLFDSSSASAVGSQDIGTHDNATANPSSRIDKSVLKVSAPRRYRDKEHLRFVARQPCLLCARKPSDPHHLRFMQPRALGRKVSDEFAVPLCRIHHRLVHRVGNEAVWWKDAGIDPVKAARQLWRQTRVNDPQDHHQPGLAAQPETRSIAAVSDV